MSIGHSTTWVNCLRRLFKLKRSGRRQTINRKEDFSINSIMSWLPSHTSHTRVPLKTSSPAKPMINLYPYPMPFLVLPLLPSRLRMQRKGGTKTKQDPAGPFQVEKHSCVLHSLVCGKDFSSLGLPQIPNSRFKPQ